MALLQASSSFVVANLGASTSQPRSAAQVTLRSPLAAASLTAQPQRAFGRAQIAQRRATCAQAANTQSAGPQNAGVVNDETFEELVLKADRPVLVDFWAPWCGPCRMIAPLIDELAKDYGDKIIALKLNTDDSPGIATEYGIRSIPTVMLFKDGQKMDTVIGAVPKSTLENCIDKFVD